MNWFYVENGKPAGPVGETEFQHMVQQGRITADTLVWHEGMTQWQPYRTVTAAPPPAAAPPPTPPAAAPPGGPADAETLERLILAAGYRVDIGRCISRAWDLLKNQFGTVVGATLVVYLVIFAAGAVPYLGGLLGLILNGPLLGGLYWLYLKRIRGEAAGVGDAFAGFGPQFGQLALANIVSSLLLFLCVVPALACLGVGFVAAARGATGGLGSAVAHLGAWLVPFVVLLVLGGLAIVYLSVCWLFMFPLILDKGLRFWPAMNLSRRVVNRHWWSLFGLLLVAGLIAVLGILLCCVGIFLTLPILLGALMYAYEDIFGSRRPTVPVSAAG